MSVEHILWWAFTCVCAFCISKAMITDRLKKLEAVTTPVDITPLVERIKKLELRQVNDRNAMYLASKALREAANRLAAYDDGEDEQTKTPPASPRTPRQIFVCSHEGCSRKISVRAKTENDDPDTYYKTQFRRCGWEPEPELLCPRHK